MCWAPGTKPPEVGLGHHMLPTSDNFSEPQEPPECPRGQVLRVDKGDAVFPPRHAKPALLPTALFMALTQSQMQPVLHSAHPLRPAALILGQACLPGFFLT